VPAVVQCAERISSAMGFIKESPSSVNKSVDDEFADDTET